MTQRLVQSDGPIRDDQLLWDTYQYALTRGRDWAQYDWAQNLYNDNDELYRTTFCLGGFRAYLDGARFISSKGRRYRSVEQCDMVMVTVKVDGKEVVQGPIKIDDYVKIRFGLTEVEADEIFNSHKDQMPGVLKDIAADKYRT